MSVIDASNFLKSLEGEWRTIADGPGGFTGKSRNVTVGDNALSLDSVANVQGGEVHGCLLLNFDPAERSFNGAGVNSAMSSMTRMKGELESSSTLILQYEGADPRTPSGKKVAYRDITTIESRDRYTVDSYVKSEAGEWVRILSIKNERIK